MLKIDHRVSDASQHCRENSHAQLTQTHAHAHAHASFISTTTKPLPDSATNTDYDTLTMTAFTTTPICGNALRCPHQLAHGRSHLRGVILTTQRS